jgi:hypothetical protein
MPIVVMKEGVKESSLKRNRQHDLPTPESPINRSLIFVVVSIARDVYDKEGNARGSRSSVFQPC